MTKTAIAAATLGVLLTGSAAFAQTSGYPNTGYPNTGYPTNNGGAGASSSSDTGSTTVPGGMRGPRAGVPNTGAGGNAPETAALLAGAAAAALVGAALLGRRKSA